MEEPAFQEVLEISFHCAFVPLYVIAVSEVHPLNALAPIVITELGISALIISFLFRKARAAITVTGVSPMAAGTIIFPW
jgi:hypothetical protein